MARVLKSARERRFKKETMKKKGGTKKSTAASTEGKRSRGTPSISQKFLLGNICNKDIQGKKKKHPCDRFLR